MSLLSRIKCLFSFFFFFFSSRRRHTRSSTVSWARNVYKRQVKDRELGTNHESKVSNLDPAHVECDEELVMPDHGTEPVVVFPPSETRDGVDGADVEGHEDESSTGAGQGFVMGRYLFGTHGLE